MKIGTCIFVTDYSIGVCELAPALEERGFESLWVPEHTHIPVSCPPTLPDGEALPKEYSHILDPFVTLTAAAAVTDKLKLGTGICLVIERDTITTAKEAASLDHISDGRFFFGIGGGWNSAEMSHHGTVFETRFRKLREQVLAMKEIWTREEAEYHGEFVDFGPIWSWPKPVQDPHPPIILGGNSDFTRQRVVDFCEGWIPLAFLSDNIVQDYADLKDRAARAGRDTASISVSVYGPEPEIPTLESYAEAGIDRVILRLPPADRETVLPLLDEYRTSLDRFF